MLIDMFFEDDEDFYSHAREGRDWPAEFMLAAQFLYFYSHAREGRDAHRSGSAHKSVHFYSHAREGRDFRGVLTQDPHQSISTHTPARGVTLKFPLHTTSNAFLLTRPRGA